MASPASAGAEPFCYQRTPLLKTDELRKMLQAHGSVGVHVEIVGDVKDSIDVAVVTLAWPTKTPVNGRQELTPSWIIHEDGSSIAEIAALIRILFCEASAVKLVQGFERVAHRLFAQGVDASKLKNVMDLQLYY